MTASVATAPALAGADLMLPQPYLLFLGDVVDLGYAKTGLGLRDWAAERVVGEFACSPAAISIGLPRLRPAEARARGARALVIGIANVGGFIAEAWVPALLEALEAGLDIVSGMHARLADTPQLKAAAERLGRRLIDVRTPPKAIPVGTGRKRTGKRLLTVGTDCVLGKKYTALCLANALQARGLNADFRATGQTGIMIAGGGMPMDAVIADFAAGAAEMLSPDTDPDHWDVIEGQGSLFHPSYAGVSLALLHGSQPDVIVVCHQPDRVAILGHEDFPLPSVEGTIALNLSLASRVNPAVRCGGVALNTAKMDEGAAAALLAKEARRLGRPVADPVRGGAAFDELVEACINGEH